MLWYLAAACQQQVPAERRLPHDSSVLSEQRPREFSRWGLRRPQQRLRLAAEAFRQEASPSRSRYCEGRDEQSQRPQRSLMGGSRCFPAETLPPRASSSLTALSGPQPPFVVLYECLVRDIFKAYVSCQSWKNNPFCPIEHNQLYFQTAFTALATLCEARNSNNNNDHSCAISNFWRPETSVQFRILY